MRKRKALLLICSLVLGLTGTIAFREPLPAPAFYRTTQLAWWGGLYPEYCLPAAMELVEGEKPGEGEEIPVKLSFKYLTFFNQR